MLLLEKSLRAAVTFRCRTTITPSPSSTITATTTTTTAATTTTAIVVVAIPYVIVSVIEWHIVDDVLHSLEGFDHLEMVIGHVHAVAIPHVSM